MGTQSEHKRPDGVSRLTASYDAGRTAKVAAIGFVGGLVAIFCADALFKMHSGISDMLGGAVVVALIAAALAR